MKPLDPTRELWPVNWQSAHNLLSGRRMLLRGAAFGPATLCRVLVLLFLCSSAGCLQPLPPLMRTARTLDGRGLPPFRDYWTAFRAPTSYNATGLYLLQPYQPGRRPLVLIHGLASDAVTWDCVVASLMSHPEISCRYQIWLYQYPTGHSYLRAAADLRCQLLYARTQLDPNHQDAAFDEMVLVGHSMGGIIAKLQVSHSDDRIWKALSDVPLESLKQTDPILKRTAEALLFEPVPFVRRVVYIATPHAGSNWTGHPLGRFGRLLINMPQQLQWEYTQFLRSNPQLFRNPSPAIPTSLDHLWPGSPVIRATNCLRYADQVETHSLIGTGHLTPDGYDGDRVVPVISARRLDVASERFVNATHSGILEHPGTPLELIRILSR